LLFPGLVKKNAKHDSFKNCLLQTKSRLFPLLSFSTVIPFYGVFLLFFLFVFQYCFPVYLILYVFYLSYSVCLNVLLSMSRYLCLQLFFLLLFLMFISFSVALSSIYYYSVGETDFDFPQNNFIPKSSERLPS